MTGLLTQWGGQNAPSDGTAELGSHLAVVCAPMSDVEKDSADRRPRILVVIPSGEAVRNFLYSETLERLAKQSSVTLLSAVHDDGFVEEFAPYCDEILPLEAHDEHPVVTRLRLVIHTAHMRWRWSKVFENNWEARSAEAKAGTLRDKARWAFLRAAARLLGQRQVLDWLTSLDRWLSVRFRPTSDFDRLIDRLQPDLVFNGMHVHGPSGDLPMRVAAAKGIPTAAFIYSWDNLTSRSRIFVPYDDYLCWSERMRRDLLELYPAIEPERTHVTGTPQFDFHRDPENLLPIEELATRIGFDPTRPFILYTTGVDRHFKEEHRTVELVAEALARLDSRTRPQLVVRTYVKGTSEAMRELMARGLPDTVFPEVEWDEKWFTPTRADLAVYSSLLHHCALGINAASTVTLELLAIGKPVINLGFDPPGSDLGWHDRWIRHIEFDHFAPVAASGTTWIARSPADIEVALDELLADPEQGAAERIEFIEDFMGTVFDGDNGARVAQVLLEIAGEDLGAKRSSALSASDQRRAISAPSTLATS